jgi:hypothetical protein
VLSSTYNYDLAQNTNENVLYKARYVTRMADEMWKSVILLNMGIHVFKCKQLFPAIP